MTDPGEEPGSVPISLDDQLLDDQLLGEDELVSLGTVVESDRGSLPFALIHGEALVATAAWAMGEAGVHLVDLGTPWSALVEAGEPFVLHDSLCPMTPPAFVAACVRAAVERDRVVVGVRPVTDTVKQLTGDVVGATLDRDALVAVTSPVVLPARVVAALTGPPSLDFAALVAALESRFEVDRVEAPSEGRRVGSRDDVALLEALTRP